MTPSGDLVVRLGPVLFPFHQCFNYDNLELFNFAKNKLVHLLEAIYSARMKSNQAPFYVDLK